MITYPKGQESAPPKPFIPRVLLDRLLKGPISKEQTSTNSTVTTLMVEPLSKRAQLFSQSIQTQVMFSGLLHQLSGLGFKKGALWDVFRHWEPHLGIPVEQLLVSEVSGLPSLSSPLSHLNLLFW